MSINPKNIKDRIINIIKIQPYIFMKVILDVSITKERDQFHPRPELATGFRQRVDYRSGDTGGY